MTTAAASKHSTAAPAAARKATNAAKTGPEQGVKRAPGRAGGPAKGRRRAKIGPREGAGERLRADIAKEGDPPAIALLIKQAARCADRLEALDRVLRGDAAGWLRLESAAMVPRDGKVPARLTVELKIDDAVREERQQAKLFAALLSDIHRQRASLPAAPQNSNGRSILEDLDED